jgi:hypothetical protein
MRNWRCISNFSENIFFYDTPKTSKSGGEKNKADRSLQTFGPVKHDRARPARPSS